MGHGAAPRSGGRRWICTNLGEAYETSEPLWACDMPDVVVAGPVPFKEPPAE
jgi:hypothetical protein